LKDKSKKFKMSYQISGSGIPVLLIHGFPLSRRMWEPQLSGLASKAQIIAPDLRGYGQSNALELAPDMQPYRMEAFAQDCANLLEDLHIDQPVVLCGLSMGGYIAFAFYQHYPQLVRGMILAATRAGADSFETKTNRDKSVELVTLKGPIPIIEGMLPKLLAPKTYTDHPEIVEKVRSVLADATTEGIIGSLLGMKEREDSTPMLSQITCPTLVIAGAEDQIIPTSEAKSMEANLPNTRLVILDEAGHLLNLEQPDHFNNTVIDFLNNIE